MLGRVASRFIKSRGLRRSLKEVREEIGVARKHRRGVRLAKRYRSARGLKVNVGRGPNPKLGWLNIDLSDTADVTLDMREPIPLPMARARSSIPNIFSSIWIIPEMR